MNMSMKRAVLTRHMDEKHSRKHWDESPDYDTDMYYDDDYDMRGYRSMGARFRDRKGREHYDNGRYAPKNKYHEHTVPPVYKEEPMNQIGFRYPMDANYHAGSHHGESEKHTMGGAKSTHALTDEMAEEWMRGLRNVDGSNGPHWSKEQVAQVAAQHNLNMSPVEAWVALNVMYSDYCKVAKAHNVNNMDFYVAMAKAFVDDADANPDKLALYYECIVN